MFQNKRVVVILSSIVAITCAIAFVAYGYFLLQPVSSNKAESIRFVIPKGQAVGIIASRLADAGLIKNSLVFRLVVKMNKLDQKLQAGSFDLSATMTASEIAQALTMGTQDVWITILEGWRVEEIAESLSEQGLDDFDAKQFIELAKQSEGMLFPDTYLIPREMSTENIFNMLINTFERKVVQDLAVEISSSNREFNDVLVMASLVEREARTYEQMRQVAGILWNRIDLDMALQVDATLQYAFGYNAFQQTWWAPPTADQKKIDSPFNTYMHTGLPPRPISNPGLDAIKAALQPLTSDDIYYLHANDGSIYTAQTLDEHNANINKYLR